MVRSRRYRKNQLAQQKKSYVPNNKKKNRKALIAVGIVALAAVAIAAFFLLGGTGLFSSPRNSPTPSPSGTPTLSPSASPTSSPSVSPSASPTADDSIFNGTKILFMTSMGNITLQLRTDKPITTGNFLNLTKQGLYDGTIFHRIIAGFMIQGGAIQSTTISSIADEIGNNNHNYNGTIAMANTGQPNSATSQFFINVADNNNLYASFDTTYTVFGRVISGMDVVMAISKVATSGDPNNTPLQDVTLLKAVILP